MLQDDDAAHLFAKLAPADKLPEKYVRDYRQLRNHDLFKCLQNNPFNINAVPSMLFRRTMEQALQDISADNQSEDSLGGEAGARNGLGSVGHAMLRRSSQTSTPVKHLHLSGPAGAPRIVRSQSSQPTPSSGAHNQAAHARHMLADASPASRTDTSPLHDRTSFMSNVDSDREVPVIEPKSADGASSTATVPGLSAQFTTVAASSSSSTTVDARDALDAVAQGPAFAAVPSASLTDSVSAAGSGASAFSSTVAVGVTADSTVKRPADRASVSSTALVPLFAPPSRSNPSTGASFGSGRVARPAGVATSGAALSDSSSNPMLRASLNVVKESNPGMLTLCEASAV